jgi:PPE-repeat protein
VVNFPMLPPEFNSLLMFSGAGSAPMLQAATAWEGLADELGIAANSFAAVTSGLAGQAWQGPASATMAAAAAPYAGWLGAASARAASAAAQAQAVVSAFETAQAATVHPLLVAANRNAFVQLVRSNFLGIFGPAIAAFESDYEAMWAAHVPQGRLRTKASMWRSPAHACSFVRPGKISTPFAQISARSTDVARRAVACQVSPSIVTVAVGLALRL